MISKEAGGYRVRQIKKQVQPISAGAVSGGEPSGCQRREGGSYGAHFLHTLSPFALSREESIANFPRVRGCAGVTCTHLLGSPLGAFFTAAVCGMACVCTC